MLRPWGAYSKLLLKHPLVTQMATTGVLVGTGDLIAQFIIEKRSLSDKTYEFSRTLRFCTLGCFVVAPPIRLWYNFLEKYVVIKRSPKLTPFVRLFFDQATFGPVFLGVFLVVLRLMEGNDVKLAVQRCRNDFLEIFIAGLMSLNTIGMFLALCIIFFYPKCIAESSSFLAIRSEIWPLAQCINFRFIPLRHRLIFNQSVALIWNTYLAWKTNQPKKVEIDS